jgi:hypothetical protein
MTLGGELVSSGCQLIHPLPKNKPKIQFLAPKGKKLTFSLHDVLSHWLAIFIFIDCLLSQFPLALIIHSMNMGTNVFVDAYFDMY